MTQKSRYLEVNAHSNKKPGIRLVFRIDSASGGHYIL